MLYFYFVNKCAEQQEKSNWSIGALYGWTEADEGREWVPVLFCSGCLIIAASGVTLKCVVYNPFLKMSQSWRIGVTFTCSHQNIPPEQRGAESPACARVWVTKRSGVFRESVVVNDGSLVVMETLTQKPLLQKKRELGDTNRTIWFMQTPVTQHEELYFKANKVQDTHYEQAVWPRCASWPRLYQTNLVLITLTGSRQPRTRMYRPQVQSHPLFSAVCHW